MATEQTEQPVEARRGGGFNPPVPTSRGGPDYGRFIEAVRTLEDHARAADADEVISEAWRRNVRPVVVKEVTVVVKRSKIRALKPHFAWWS
jgi:hypothetical protein